MLILTALSLPPTLQPYRCNGCNMSPLEGPRYHCQVCADFDFCQSCFDKGQSHNHAFERIDDQGHPAVFVGSPRSRRRALRFVSCPLTFPSLSLYRSWSLKLVIILVQYYYGFYDYVCMCVREGSNIKSEIYMSPSFCSSAFIETTSYVKMCFNFSHVDVKRRRCVEGW